MKRSSTWIWILLAFGLLPSCCYQACPPCEVPCETVQEDVGTGRLRVVSVPPADVWVDGTSLGVSPVETTMASGSHAIRVRLGGFAVHESTATVKSGESTDVNVRLVLLDAEEREALQMFADAALPEEQRLWVQLFDEPRGDRGGGEAKTARALYPRGDVRTKDLAGFRIELAPGTRGEGAIEFHKGKKVLHRQVVKASGQHVLTGKIPKTVQTALEAGDQVRWGFYPPQGTPRTATFSVVKRDLTNAMGTLGKTFEGQPELAAAHVRAQLLLNNGLYYAAHEEARSVLSEDKNSVRAWAVVLEALEKMGVGSTATAWKEAQRALSGVKGPAKQQVHFMEGAALQRVGSHLERGDAGRALSTLRSHVQGGTAPGVWQLRGLAEAAAGSAGVVARKAPGAGRKLVKELRGLIGTARDAATDAESVRWAQAHLYVAEGRMLVGAGSKPGPELWMQAVSEVESALADQPDAAAGYARAVRWLHEAAGLRGVDPKPVLARAAQVSDRLTLRFPDAPEAALSTASTHLIGLRLKPRATRNELRGMLTESLDALRPHLAKDHPEPAIGTLHTQAVTLSKVRKLGMKVDYHPVEVYGSRSLLKTKLPLSERWQSSEDPLGRYILFVRNLDEAGALQRVITVGTIEWFTRIRYPNGRETSGENIGALSKHGMTETLARFGKVKKKRRTFVRKLSARFKRAYHYEITGATRDGSYLRLRSWWVKSKEHKMSYHVTVQDLIPDLPARDPELSLVLESLADVERTR